MSQDDMALVEPMPPLPDATFGRFNTAQLQRRGSDVVTSPTCTNHLPVPILAFHEFQQWLGTSPTGGLDFLAGDSNFFSFSSVPATMDHRARENGRTTRAPLLKSRSFPKARHEDPNLSLSTSTPHRPPLRKAKSVKFADSQGLPLVEAVHELTRQDSSYTARKIVPYADDDFLAPVHLLASPQASSRLPAAQRSSSSPASVPSARENKPQKFTRATQRTGTDGTDGGSKKSDLAPGSSKLSSSNKANVRRQNSPPKFGPTHRHKLAFTQPSLEPDFFNRVSRDCVCLESIREEPRCLHGIVRVSNLSYAKEVAVRWTHDNWKTSHDTQAVFLSNHGATDRFAFELPINGDDVSFAIRFRSEGSEYWDNNRGSNYTVLSLSDWLSSYLIFVSIMSRYPSVVFVYVYFVFVSQSLFV